jgi:uncharacterized protein involved in type VI secretion and phage assembly
MLSDYFQHELIHAWMKGHHFGKYRGTVTDNKDPDNRGRLKVHVPSVLQAVESWAMPCVPYAGNKVGFYSLPEVGTGVWVEFEAGDASMPIWTGFFWGDNELPDPGGAPIKIWKTNKVTIRIDDDNDELKMEVTSGSKITIAGDIQSESGNAKHTVGGSGIVSELGSGKVEVTSSSVAVNGGAFEVK